SAIRRAMRSRARSGSAVARSCSKSSRSARRAATLQPRAPTTHLESMSTTSADTPPDRWTGRFFLPGPTEVRDAVLRAQTQPMIGHRGAGFEALMTQMEPTLRAIFRTERPVYVAACSATGMMEAALRNGARARVLSLVNGAFSDRFFQIARACGFHAE